MGKKPFLNLFFSVKDLLDFIMLLNVLICVHWLPTSNVIIFIKHNKRGIEFGVLGIYLTTFRNDDKMYFVLFIALSLN